MPSAFRQLTEAREIAERHFQDVCDLEFSVQDGQLYVLQARRAKRTSIANLRFPQGAFTGTFV
jgi:pyruvate,orthophosphate dikinase